MPNNDHPWLGVDAIIQNDKGDFLLVKRSANSKLYPDMWSLISGKVEWGEEVKEAVAREVKEETGLDVETIKFTGKYYDTRGRHPHKTMICLPHYCRIIAGEEKINKENSEIGWFSKDEVSKMYLAFDHKDMLFDEGLL